MKSIPIAAMTRTTSMQQGAGGLGPEERTPGQSVAGEDRHAERPGREDQAHQVMTRPTLAMTAAMAMMGTAARGP
jgi:hypothetical protein